MRHNLLLAATIAAAVAAQSAQAGSITLGAAPDTVTLSAQSAANAPAPFVLDNPGSAATGPGPGGSGLISTLVSGASIGGATITIPSNASTPHSGLYNGNTASVSTSPFLGTRLTPTDYFDAEPADAVDINFAAPQTSFALLWGTVDNYNNLTLEFCTTATKACASTVTVTGDNIVSAVNAGVPLSSPQFTDNGTTSAFVEISTAASFDEIVLTSAGVSFEFVPEVVPEPFTISILAVGFAGLGLARRRRQPAAC